MTDTFTKAADSASSLSSAYLIDAAKCAREAEEARANGDHVMAERYEAQAARYHDEADKCEDRARWYRSHAAMAAVPLTYPKIETQVMEAAE
jgi:hypothetical protein